MNPDVSPLPDPPMQDLPRASTAITAPSRPHPYQPRPNRIGLCTCGLRTAHRNHQPLWWRWLHPMAGSR